MKTKEHNRKIPVWTTVWIPVFITLGILILLSFYGKIVTSGENADIVIYLIGILLGVLTFNAVFRGVRAGRTVECSKLSYTKTEQYFQWMFIGIIVLSGILIGLLILQGWGANFSPESIGGVGVVIGGLLLISTAEYKEAVWISRKE